METVPVSKSQSENSFKFSEPLPIINPLMDSESAAKNEGFYKFSQPLDVMSSKSKAGATNSLDTPQKNSSAFTGFDSQIKRSRKEWECYVCMVYNTPEWEKCAACEAPRKAPTITFDSSIAQQFKKSADKWECATCWVQNTQEKTKCIACEEPRAGSCKSEADEGFKTLAYQQKTSKWECSACLTQNDNKYSKCACCEQLKEGHAKKSEATQLPAGNGTNGPTENDLRKASTIEAAEKTATKYQIGFPFMNTTPSDESFKALASQQKASKWECSTCLTQNDNKYSKCACCEQLKEDHAKKSEATQLPAGNGTKDPTENDLRKASTIEGAEKRATKYPIGTPIMNTTPSDEGFKALASQQKASNWECRACMTQNKNDSINCVCWAKQTPCKETKEKLSTTSLTPAFTFGFGKESNADKTTSQQEGFQFGFKSRDFTFWECDTCLVRNKAESTKCICCGSVRQMNYPQTKFKSGLVGFDTAQAVADFKTLVSQQKTSKWECSTCMTQNDLTKVKCVCCEESKPGAVISETNSGNSKLLQNATNTSFRFGFFPETKSSAENQLIKELESKTSQIKKSGSEVNNEKPLIFGFTLNKPADDKFKALAVQQKASKWECDACMTQNDNTLLKCACCEQVKPGEKMEVKTALQTDVNTSKFRFGFGDGNNAPTEEELRKKL